MIRSRLVRRLIVPVVACLAVASACSDSSSEPSEADGTDRGTGAPQGEQDPDSSEDGDPDAGDPERDAGDPEGNAGETDQDDPTEAAPTPSITEDQLSERLSGLDGRLAVGNGPEVAVARPDGARIDVLDGAESVVAAQPTWSSDGSRLAWSSISADRQLVLIQEFDDQGERAGEPLSSDAAGNPVFYLQWNDGDRRLAYIRNATGGVVVEVGTVVPGEPVQPTGEGAPFFISWSPAPDRLLGHVSQSSIELHDDAAGATGFAPVTEVVGGFSAPAWVDERRALVVDDGWLSYLDVETGDLEQIIDVGGSIRFVLSPDRTRVAFQAIGGEVGPSLISRPTASPGSGSRSAAQPGRRPVQADRLGLIVLDLTTGVEEIISPDLAVAWEWSPDSGSVAWLEAQIQGGLPIGRWNFWSSERDLGTERSTEFVVTRKYGQAYLPFFAQYAQSTTGWAPDSSAFAFAGAVGDERGIWVQLVDETIGPRRVAPGDYVTWGPGPTPAPDGRPSAA